jgi:hypothetical protein
VCVCEWAVGEFEVKRGKERRKVIVRERGGNRNEEERKCGRNIVKEGKGKERERESKGEGK